MDKEALAAIVGLLGTVMVIIKLLINAYFKKANQYEALKNNYTVSQIKELKKIIGEITIAIENFKVDMRAQGDKTKELNLHINSFITALKTYVEVNNKKTDEIRSDIVKLGKDIIMLKARK